MNIFTISPNDQSVAYLTQIFGHVGTVLSGQSTAGAPMLLGAMFKTFNTVMLSLGALVIVYTTVVGLLATAHEGEFMGKKWSGLWVPLRSLMGIAALFPTTTGYSAMQVIVMWVILQGIGAADMLWNTVLSYTEIAGSPLQQGNFPGAGINQKMQTIFQGLTCQATSLNKEKVGTKPFYYCANHAGWFCESSNEDLINLAARSTPASGEKLFNYPMGPDGSCGMLTYCNPKGVCKASNASIAEQVECETCKAQGVALTQVVSTLGKIAGKFSQADQEYIHFYNSFKLEKPPEMIQAFCDEKKIPGGDCCTWTTLLGKVDMPPVPCKFAGLFPAPYVDASTNWMSPSKEAVTEIYYKHALATYLEGMNYLDVSTNYYVSGLSGAVTTFMSTLKPSQLSDTWRKTAQANGWIVAGAFYNSMADDSNQMLDNARPKFDVVAYDKPGGKMLEYRNNFEGANFLGQQSQETNAASPSPEMARLSSDLEQTANGIFNNWRNSLRQGASSNPLAELHLFGKQLLITAEVLYPILVLVAIAIGGSKISFIALGTGPINPMEWIGYGLLYGIVFPGFAILGVCFTFGGMLAVYVPLIPYVIFTLSALGWFISTLEAMIASPLIALGILSPGGQHEILGRSENALMLLLGVMLRPSLMIFGLMAAMLLSYAALLFINNTFALTMSAITERPSIIELVLFLATYTFLIVAVLNKCFGMIHLIPERVMTWIGGQAVSYGEGEGAGETKRGAEGAGVAAAGMAKSSQSAATDLKRKKEDKTGKANT